MISIDNARRQLLRHKSVLAGCVVRFTLPVRFAFFGNPLIQKRIRILALIAEIGKVNMMVESHNLGGHLAAVKAHNIGNGVRLEMAVANTDCFYFCIAG